MINLTQQEYDKLAQFREGEWQHGSGFTVDGLKCRGLLQAKYTALDLMRLTQTAIDMWNGRSGFPTLRDVTVAMQEYRITRRGIKANRHGVIRAQDRNGKWMPLQPKYGEAA